MLAIYQANPRAFDQNMNLLRSGAVLRMPDAATAAAVPPAQASAEIRRQYAAWRESAGGEAPAATAPGRLKLVPPSAGASVGTTPAAPNADATALQGRVHDLESQLADSKRLLEMKNAELARLQSQLAAKQGAAATPPPATPPATPPAQAVTPPAATPPAATATPPAPPAAAPPVEEQPAAPVAPPPAVKVAPPPVHNAAPSAAGGSLFDTLKSY
jgi:pilus assembly protein FimV